MRIITAMPPPTPPPINPVLLDLPDFIDAPLSGSMIGCTGAGDGSDPARLPSLAFILNISTPFKIAS
ncbi:hypothetical protein HanPI659440_Chr15g0576541 [Helianthus annuus]|nr:hypothetical protein HanPI659440_Chr15g0576541 [Helianthus annuus]